MRRRERPREFDKRGCVDRNWRQKHGVNGWENSISVVDGAAEDVILNEAEALWLKACWQAATVSASS